MVEAAIHGSVLSLTARDATQAEEVLRNEARINQMQIRIDDQAAQLLALEQPVARDLRLIMSAIKINNDLERMGDQAVNIAQRAQRLMKEAPVGAPVDIPEMAELAQKMVRRTLDAFVHQDPAIAREVIHSDDAVDELRRIAYRELLKYMKENPQSIDQCVSLMFAAHSLERIADHATNIAEDVLFLVQGIDVRHHAESTSGNR